MQRLADTADGIAVVIEIEQLCDNLGVGIRQKLVALVVNQKLFELLVILNNAVMDDRHASARMGVRIDVRRLAVRRPARMTDARVSVRFSLSLHFVR